MLHNYHLLVDAIKDYAIYMLDTTGHVATWNKGAERLKGYTEEEILGQPFSIFFTRDDRQKGKPEKELETALLKGRYEEEGWRVRKDGTRFWANIIITPVFSDDNEHVGYAKITRDLTEKRRSEELYLLLVSQVKEYAIFMMDTTGQILTWNDGAERIKGYVAPEIIGKHFSVFYTPEDKESQKPKRALEEAVRTGKYEEEGWRVKKDGNLFWASIVITPIYTDKHIGFAKVTRDLTQRKEMERLNTANVILESTNKELERFAFTASHDLKEPLRKINMFSSIVLHDKQQPLAAAQKEHLRKVISTCKRMDTMIEDILNFSMLSKKQHFEKYSLQRVLSETLELLEETIRGKNVSIQYPELPDAIIIPSQMRQLFQNLMSNAIKFSKKNIPPEIYITHELVRKDKVNATGLWPSEEYLVIRFRDNGIGFEPEYAEQIFNLFDRLHARSDYEGSGLGLAICRKIAENHGGNITARSELGKGAEFTLIIPA
ncbi:MAG TPA: PAS domain S-box protein [Chitinophagaceae bacterium]|nr:PAS domain S-box protein [Chitinophagaceae bacterium]